MSAEPEGVHEHFVAGNVTPRGTERFCERSHEDVDVARADVEVVADAAAIRAYGAD